MACSKPAAGLVLIIGMAVLLPAASAQAVRTLQTPSGGVTRKVVPPPPPAPAYMRIRMEGDLVSAEIVSTPLSVVLAEIAARTGIVFELATQDSTLVSVSFYKATLQETVDRLIANNNSIFYYSNEPAGQSRIAFVRIFPRGNKPTQASRQYIGTGSITKSGDDFVDTPDQAFKVLAEGANPDARQKAIEVLAAAKGEAAIQAITKALSDTSPEVRAGAIEALAGMGEHASLPQILVALKDPHPGVRQSAVVAVALLGDAENVRDVKPLVRDKDASVAAAAETALKKLALRHP